MRRNTNSSRGQMATEVLVIVGMMLLLLLPLLFYSYGRANVAREDIAVQKAEFAAQRLASAADSVGYLGGAAGLVEEIEIPSNVKSLKIEGHDIVFDIDSATGKKQIVKSTAFLIDSRIGTISRAGTYFFEITALSENISKGAAQVKIGLK